MKRRPAGSSEGWQFAPDAHSKKPVMIDPEQVARWQQADFDAVEASDWIDWGFDPEEAKRWQNYGFNPDEASEWLVAGFTPEEACNWHFNFFYNSRPSCRVAQSRIQGFGRCVRMAYGSFYSLQSCRVAPPRYRRPQRGLVTAGFYCIPYINVIRRY